MTTREAEIKATENDPTTEDHHTQVYLVSVGDYTKAVVPQRHVSSFIERMTAHIEQRAYRQEGSVTINVEPIGKMQNAYLNPKYWEKGWSF